VRAPRPSDFPARLVALTDPREPEAVRYVVETRLLTYELEEDLVWVIVPGRRL
jgi:hypothetical protein